ncbi:hypothetical protein ES708_04570 [subsurface metagenome]
MIAQIFREINITFSSVKGGAMKKKGAGMVMTIMLVAVCGWVAIVAFVIKPDIGYGVALSVCGGAAIGLAIVCLMSKWWFKGIHKGG